SVGINQHRDPGLFCELNKTCSRIDLLRLLAKAGRVDLKCHVVPSQRFDYRFVIATQISCRPIAKFLRQVRVSDKIKEPTLDAPDVLLPIQLPDLFDRVLFESRQVFRVVYVPTRGDVMDASDEIVPRRLSCQLLNPGFVARYEITLQPKANGEPGR